MLRKENGGQHLKRTKVVILQGLSDSRDEGRRVYRIFQYTMGILQDEQVITVSTFEEQGGSHRWDQGPQ